MQVQNPFTSLFKKVRLWRKSKRLAKFKRLPRVFIPTPSKWQIVIPYKPIGVFLILVLAGLCTYLVFRSDLLLVRKIEVKGINGEKGLKGFVSEEQVRETISAYLAKSIVFLDTKEIAENLKKQFLPIAEVKVEKQLPDKLVVQIREREPVAILVVQKEGEEGKEGKFLVDGTGFLFARCPRGVDLPELQIEWEEGGGGIKIGGRVQGSLVTAALQIIGGFAKIENLQPTAIKIQNQNEIRVDTNKDFFVIFTIEKKINEQILVLSQIYENSERQGKTLKKVDLRFKLPVVLY